MTPQVRCSAPGVILTYLVHSIRFAAIQKRIQPVYAHADTSPSQRHFTAVRPSLAIEEGNPDVRGVFTCGTFAPAYALDTASTSQ